MRSIAKVFLTGLLLLLGHAVHAETEVDYRFQSGSCGTGSSIDKWWSVTTYVDGVPVSVTGMNCHGVRYYCFPIQRVSSPTNPIIGMTPTHVGLADDGSILWQSVSTYDATTGTFWMGGIDMQGRYWNTSFTPSGIQPEPATPGS